MNNSLRYAKLLVLASVLLCALALPGAAITLTPTITNLSGGLVRYEYSVNNTSLFDFSAISISVIAAPNAVQNLITATGFNAFFDPGLGQVDFVEDTQNFTAGSTISGFAFDSPFAPGSSIFTALRLDQSENPVTLTGTTQAPISIPEPAATMGLLGIGLAGLALMKIRRRKLRKVTALCDLFRARTRTTARLI